MRPSDLLVAIGAGLGFASANVDCNPKALHDTAQVIADSANEEFKKSVQDLCSSHNGKKNTEHHFGSVTLGLNRTCSDCTWNVFCAQQFNSIIKECIVDKTLAGGTARMGGMIAEVSIDASLIESAQANAQDFRKMRIARMVKREPKKSKQPKPPKEQKPPKEEKPKVKAEKKPKATPKPKACRPRKNPGKKGHQGRSVISKLFRRAGSSSDEFPVGPSTQEGLTSVKTPEQSPKKDKGKGKAPAENPAKRPAGSPTGGSPEPKRPAGGAEESEGCQDEIVDELMYRPAGWGSRTFFGRAKPKDIAKPPTKLELQEIAHASWKEINNKHSISMLTVSALFVPYKGIYLGSIIKKGVATTKFEEELPKFTTLAKALEDRAAVTNFLSKYHAEDAAMWYAFHNGAVGANEHFPEGSIVGSYGEDGKMDACETGRTVRPGCQKVLKDMGISF